MKNFNDPVGIETATFQPVAHRVPPQKMFLDIKKQQELNDYMRLNRDYFNVSVICVCYIQAQSRR
jgi:hypothetical protein